MFLLRLGGLAQCNAPVMILLVTASSNGTECAKALLAAVHEKTQVASDIRAALTCLRENEYQAVVMDESMTETSASQIDVVMKHLGTAIPVFVNLGVSRKDRVVRDVVTALRRVEAEKTFARKSVEWDLRSQLKADLTGIMLSAEQALASTLPSAAEAKLKTVCELAERMKARLSTAGGD
jgi:DNA-binding NtrC family response regulator